MSTDLPAWYDAELNAKDEVPLSSQTIAKPNVSGCLISSMPLLKETGYNSFCDYHVTRYWEYKVNGHFFGLTRNLKGTITHYDNDVSYAKKFHVWIDYGGCVAPKELNTDSFREAYDFLIKCTVKPLFTHGVSKSSHYEQGLAMRRQ